MDQQGLTRFELKLSLGGKSCIATTPWLLEIAATQLIKCSSNGKIIVIPTLVP